MPRALVPSLFTDVMTEDTGSPIFSIKMSASARFQYCRSYFGHVLKPEETAAPKHGNEQLFSCRFEYNAILHTRPTAYYLC